MRLEREQPVKQSYLGMSDYDLWVIQMVGDWINDRINEQVSINGTMGAIVEEKDACHIRSNTIKYSFQTRMTSNQQAAFMRRLYKLLPRKWQRVLTKEHLNEKAGKAHKRKAEELGLTTKAYETQLKQAYEHIAYIWNNRHQIMT